MTARSAPFSTGVNWLQGASVFVCVSLLVLHWVAGVASGCGYVSPCLRVHYRPYTARPATMVGPQPSRCGLTMTVLLLLASWLSVQELALLMMLNIIRKIKKYVILASASIKMLLSS